MKSILISALLCGLAVAMPGIGNTTAMGKEAIKTASTQPSTQPAKPINKFCAVDRENPVDDTVPTVTYEGKVIGFCCEDCIPKFKKNPARYMKDLK